MKRFKYMALAALVAFAACDEGGDVIVPVDVTGDIAGVVTIEGAAVSGVTVTLSSGVTTTTDGSGAYSFADVAAGAYTITISGFAADATFSSTSKAATIVTTGQVATVNFDGAYIRTSAILGSVAAGGKNLAGVTVSIGSSTTQTDANGNYSFSGLRAGTYTLTVSGFNASQYAFATSTQNVTLGVGESKVVSFNGQLLATSTISGTLYIDGNGNLSFDTGEPAVAKAGITVALERAIGDTIYTTTDANGAYAFADLEEGTYKVILLPQAAFPGAFTQTSEARYLAVATASASTTVNFAFTITTQYVQVYGMLGVDGKNVGVSPITNWSIGMFPTQLDAVASTFPVATAVKTDANGLSTFKFLRTADYSPNAATVDGIVFAKVAAPAGYTVSGETVIEIPWSPLDSIVMAPDTFDAILASLTIAVKAEEVDGDALSGWVVSLRQNKDSTFAAPVAQATNSKGMAYYTISGFTGVETAPDTFWVRMASTQAGAGTHAFTTAATGDEGSAVGVRWLKYIWDGAVAPSDTVMLGTEKITYADTDLRVRVHHEADDSALVSLTLGDDFQGVGNVDVQLYTVGSTGTLTSVAGVLPSNPITIVPGAANAGIATWTNVATGKNYAVKTRISSGATHITYVADTIGTKTLDGGAQVDSVNAIGTAAGFGTFAFKFNNTQAKGFLRSDDGTAVAAVKVRVKASATNGGGTQDTTVTASATGAWSTNANLLEGPYDITVVNDSSAVWGFSRTLKTTDQALVPVIGANPGGSGDAANAAPASAVRDQEGTLDVTFTNFLGDRLDTKIRGVVINDRDLDANTIDPGEALSGVEVDLYKDNSGTPTVNADSLVATATTDPTGAYTFSDLPEGTYVVKPRAGTPTGVTLDGNAPLRALTNGDTAHVRTQASTACDVNGENCRTVGAVSGINPLPNWNYLTSSANNIGRTHFTFLYKDGTMTGTVTMSVGGAAVQGITVSAVKCATVGTNPSPPAGGACTTTIAGTAVNAITDSTGKFTFSNVAEGVWQVTPNAATAGLTGVVTPAAGSLLFTILGTADVETGNFTMN